LRSYGWLWFQDGDNRRKRKCLVADVAAGFVGLAVARVLALTVVRPQSLNVPELMTRIPYGIEAASWEGWNSFPSDHAVLFFGLATGIFFASRRVGVFTFIYLTAFICLPRLYLGIHYPTDILSGPLIGISAGWLANRPAIAEFLSDWAFRWLDARPGQFYSFAFLLSYLLSKLFDPAIRIAHFVLGKHPVR